MEKGSKLKGKFIEDLGWYNPHAGKFSVREERVKYWIANGAQPSDSIRNLLISSKIIEGKKIPLHKKSKHPAETSKGELASGTNQTINEKLVTEMPKEEISQSAETAGIEPVTETSQAEEVQPAESAESKPAEPVNNEPAEPAESEPAESAEPEKKE